MKNKETIVLALTNLKGGVGKTTSSANIGAGLAKMDYKVLLIDWDPQGNLTKFYGLDKEEKLRTTYDALDPKMEEYYHPEKIEPYQLKHLYENLYILPTDYELAQFDAIFGQSSIQGSDFVLENVIQPFLDDFDFIIIDTNPALSKLTINAFYASDYLIIPVEAGGFSVEGLDKILNVKKQAKKFYKRDIDIAGVFFSRAKPNTVLTKDYFRDFKTRNDVNTFDTIIRDVVPLAESLEMSMDIFSYDKYQNDEIPEEKYQQINGVEDYYNLTNEILHAIGVNKKFESSREPTEKEIVEKDVVKKHLTVKKGNLKGDFQDFLNKK